MKKIQVLFPSKMGKIALNYVEIQSMNVEKKENICFDDLNSLVLVRFSSYRTGVSMLTDLLSHNRELWY